MAKKKDDGKGLMTLRALVLIYMALNAGLIAGLLTYAIDGSIPAAVTYGSGAAFAALAVLNKVVVD